MAERTRGMDGELEKEKLKEEINKLAQEAAVAKNEGEKREIIYQLWLKIKPGVLGYSRRLFYKHRSTMDSFRPEVEINDLEQEGYMKVAAALANWNEVDDFNNYFITAIKNNFLTHVRESLKTKNVSDRIKSERDYTASDYNQKSAEGGYEDKITINKIKSKLVDWVKSGELQTAEALVLILRFGLGEDVFKQLSDLEKSSQDELLFKILNNIDIKNVDFNLEMDQASIAQLLGYKSQGTIFKIITRGINKVRAILKVL